MAKEAVNAGVLLQFASSRGFLPKWSFSAEELTLASGLQFESRLYHSTFGTEDAREGMTAFAEKRAPVFNGK